MLQASKCKRKKTIQDVSTVRTLLDCVLITIAFCVLITIAFIVLVFVSLSIPHSFFVYVFTIIYTILIPHFFSCFFLGGMNTNSVFVLSVFRPDGTFFAEKKR